MFDPRDFDGQTIEGNERERRELIAQHREENDDRERIACAEADYYSALHPAQIEAPTIAAMIAARSIAETSPVHAALTGWRKAVTPALTAPFMGAQRYAEIGNGLFVRVGKRRAA